MRSLTSVVANRRGHSLIETVTVLVLILLIITMAGPKMNNYVGHAKTRRALDRVANDIALTRMSAVRAGNRASITFTSTGYTIALELDPDSVIRRVYLSAEYGGATVTPPTQSGELVFDSRGLLLGTAPGPVVVTVGGSSDSAYVTTAGRVYRAF